ncbi:hypothetical protein FQR65_LT06767 [Abscondita terminalis]|nr:hypothetical protein FQR65_LT06767 [Abscondita terminalis]
MSSGRMYKKFIYNNPYKGLPALSNFQLTKDNLRTIKENEYLAEAVFIRATPNYATANSLMKLNTSPKATQLAKIIESKNKYFPVGQYIVGDFGWQTHTILEPCNDDQVYLVPELNSYSVGIIGTPGIAAYFGLLEICKPQENDVVVVSSAAGAVGSCVGQIAKIKGCKVIGLTSSDVKCSWLKEIGFDHCINYKKEDVKRKLEEYAPQGVDCYFDNVGGELSNYVIYQMKVYGRICICGATALYYDDNKKVPEIQSPVKIKMVKMEGVHVTRWKNQWDLAVKQNLDWLNENKLKHKETIVEDFDNLPQVFVDTITGKYFGNVIIKV